MPIKSAPSAIPPVPLLFHFYPHFVKVQYEGGKKRRPAHFEKNAIIKEKEKAVQFRSGLCNTTQGGESLEFMPFDKSNICNCAFRFFLTVCKAKTEKYVLSSAFAEAEHAVGQQ